jgi:hypothetical protein
MADILTVGDLIAELQKLPADKPIIMIDEEGDRRSVSVTFL